MPYLKKSIYLLLGLFILTALTKNIFEYRKNLQFYNDYKSEYEIEKKRNNKLKTALVKSNDYFEFEKNIRDRLNLHQKNESIIIIPNPTPTIFVPSPTVIPNLKKWLNVFSGS